MSRRRWRGSLAGASSAIAHRLGPLPAAPSPRTPPPRTPRGDAPYMTGPGELAGLVVTRQVRQSPGEMITGTGPERRALSGLAPPASRVPGDRF